MIPRWKEKIKSNIVAHVIFMFVNIYHILITLLKHTLNKFKQGFRGFFIENKN